MCHHGERRRRPPWRGRYGCDLRQTRHPDLPLLDPVHRFVSFSRENVGHPTQREHGGDTASERDRRVFQLLLLHTRPEERLGRSSYGAGS